MNLSKTEQEYVNITQAAVGVTKEELRDAEQQAIKAASAMRKMAAENREAGRLEEANAAMLFEGELIDTRGLIARALGKITAAHAVASNALIKSYDEGPEIVVLGGGGR